MASRGRPPKTLPYNSWNKLDDTGKIKAWQRGGTTNTRTEYALIELGNINSMADFVRISQRQREQRERIG